MAQRKAETLALSSPDALEPSSALQKRKAAHRSSPPSPKRLALHEEQVVPSAIAHVAAARCGSDEGDVAALLMTRPLMAATRVFDFVQMSSYTQTERELSVLLNHFSSPFSAPDTRFPVSRSSAGAEPRFPVSGLGWSPVSLFRG